MRVATSSPRRRSRASRRTSAISEPPGAARSLCATRESPRRSTGTGSPRSPCRRRSYDRPPAPVDYECSNRTQHEIAIELSYADASKSFAGDRERARRQQACLREPDPDIVVSHLAPVLRQAVHVGSDGVADGDPRGELVRRRLGERHRKIPKHTRPTSETTSRSEFSSRPDRSRRGRHRRREYTQPMLRHPADRRPERIEPHTLERARSK